MEENKVLTNVFKKSSVRRNDIQTVEEIKIAHIQHAKEKNIINIMYLDNDTNIKNTDPYKHIYKIINRKIQSYIQQYIKKERLNITAVVTIDYVIEKLVESKLQCCYCKDNVVIDYHETRQMNQWTLDRINNFIGHDIDNVVISCLKCNLQRRRINKEHFTFTKQLVLIKTES